MTRSRGNSFWSVRRGKQQAPLREMPSTCNHSYQLGRTAKLSRLSVRPSDEQGNGAGRHGGPCGKGRRKSRETGHRQGSISWEMREAGNGTIPGHSAWSRPPVRSRRSSRRANDSRLCIVLHQDPLPYLGGRKADEGSHATVGQRINSPLRYGYAEDCKSLHPV